MDVMTHSEKTLLDKLKNTKLFAIFAFALLTLIIWLKSSYNVGVQRDHINIKSVKRGDLPLVINT
uniref:hypothetical protein n=1 Tax=Pseudoalteromonas sp. TaxID=53249 RepID=UPI00356A164F